MVVPIVVSPLHDALLVVDMQNDFVRPDGALSVSGAAEVIPVVNRLCGAHAFRAVVATKDWHPPDHSSFRAAGGRWPAHCVQGTMGAALHPLLRLGGGCHVVQKGTDAAAECYSGFGDEKGRPTGLGALLRKMGVRRVFVCGVAFDYCVYYTALGALKERFEVVVLEDATRPVCARNVPERRCRLQREGAVVADSGSLVTCVAASSEG